MSERRTMGLAIALAVFTVALFALAQEAQQVTTPAACSKTVESKSASTAADKALTEGVPAESQGSASCCGSWKSCDQQGKKAHGHAVKVEQGSNPQTHCPVMGGPIKKELYADYEGKRVYFCCPSCKGTFEKDPATYIEKLETQGITPDKVWKPQSKCPLSDKPIKKDLYAEYQGERVYFCGPGCKAAFEKNPEKYTKQMERQGIALEKVKKPQTHCPVMGGPVNKELYADHQGKRVYFCCAGCVGTFKENPEKYIEKLESQGVTLEEAL